MADPLLETSITPPTGPLPSELWTLGHSSRTWEEFLALLQSQSIAYVVDVRRFAGSRKYPQFGQDQLAPALAAENIGYRMIEELGGRRKPRDDSPNTLWRHPSFRAYADHMTTAEYRDGRAQLLQQACDRRTAVLCSEAVWWRCHRSMIADDLKAAGVQVLHIMSATKTVEHPYTAPASVENGMLRYGPAVSEPGTEPATSSKT